MSDQQEVDYDTLEYLPEGVFLLDGQPFTGLGVQHFPDRSKRCEVPFVDGREHGLARSWHRNGQLEGETPYVRGFIHGPTREWFEDGSLRSEELVEFGLLMRREVRNEQQEVVEWYDRPATDPMFPKIIEWRKKEETR